MRAVVFHHELTQRFVARRLDADGDGEVSRAEFGAAAGPLLGLTLAPGEAAALFEDVVHAEAAGLDAAAAAAGEGGAAASGGEGTAAAWGHVVNVNALEGKFNVSKKSGGHPHTNMAKVGERERESRHRSPPSPRKTFPSPTRNARAAHRRRSTC